MARDYWGPGDDGPNLERTLESLRQRLRRFGGRGRTGWVYALVAVVVIWLLTGIYIVNPGERAVVRRFGAMIGMVQEGIHYKLPWPVDRVDVVNVDQIRSMELGFRTVSPNPPARTRSVPVESHMITGDENLVNIHMVLQYRISDLPAYLFKVWDPQGSPEGRTLRDAAEAALRGVVGSMKIDDILTTGRAQVQAETKAHLQELMRQYQTGLAITEVKLQAVDPPEPVQEAFKDVVSAKEDRQRIINEAKSYQEDILPKARGKADQIVRDAEAYEARRVNAAQGDAARFLSMLTEYRQAREVTRQRLYLETMQEVLSKVQKVVVSDRVGDKALPLLPLTEDGAGLAPRKTQSGGQQ